LQHISRLGLLVLSASLSTASGAQVEPSSIQQCVAAEADREGLSGSILVSQRDKTLASVARGKLADDASPPIDANTRFNLGSASKMFTAVAIGQLIQAGKLQLDEPVGQIVSGLTPEASKVTIRQLLNHTSGLGDFFRPENMAAMLKARSASDILPLIATDKPAFPPGAKFDYSNSGYALLGVVVERLSGMTYGQYLQRHIFAPAAMTSTGLDPKPLARLAVGMTAGGLQIRQPGNSGLMLIGPDGKPLPPRTQPPSGTDGLRLIGPDGRSIDPASAGSAAPSRPAPGATEGYGSPAGGLFSTAADMHRFAMALMAGKLLPRAIADEFTSPQVESGPAANGQPARHYGFGFTISDQDGLRWFGHGGGTLGANAEFSIQPHHQWVISVLSNRDPPTATNIMRWTRAFLAGSSAAPKPDHQVTCAVAP
jgi:CubicO group peptidase (beta-lactamase class C family)